MAELFEWDAEQQVGAKILEMCDRVRVAHICLPGAIAKSGIEVDGVIYEVTVRVAPLTGEDS